MGTLRGLAAYYWATPLFFLADHFLGWDVRAAALEEPRHRFAYYGACLLCAGAMRAWPRSAPFVAMGESALNILLLVLGVWLPILGALDAVGAGGPLEPGLTSPKLANFALSGTILWLGFQRAQGAIGRSLPGRRRGAERGAP